MARKTPSRLELRRQAEAAESQEATTSKKTAKKKTAKKKATAKKTTTRKKRTKEKTPQRKRLVWGVFSGSMKEEARFSYDQRDSAEDKIQQLRTRSPKKLFFIQPIKEPLPEPVAVEPEKE